MNPADLVARLFVLIVLVTCAILFAEIIRDAVRKQIQKSRIKKNTWQFRHVGPRNQDWFFENIEEYRNDFR